MSYIVTLNIYTFVSSITLLWINSRADIPVAFLSKLSNNQEINFMFLPETMHQQHRSEKSIMQAFTNYKVLFSNKKFMQYTLCLTFFYIAAYAFIAGSPAVYITYFKVSEEYYGWLFAINVAGLVGFSLLNRRFVKIFNLDHILRTATIIAMLSGIILMIIVKFSYGGLPAVVTGIFF